MPGFSRYEKESGVSYACGVFPAIELVRRRPEALKAVLLRQEAPEAGGTRALLDMLPPGAYVEVAPRAIAKISPDRNESFHAVAAFGKYECRLSPERPHIVLHEVSDMGNLGTITRTCLGFGFKDIALIRPCADIFDPRCVRAGMGAVFGVEAEYFDSIDSYFGRFGDHTPYFFRLKNAESIYSVTIAGLPALIFGNEGAGLPERLCDIPTGVVIPHSGEIDSLNLAVAAGIGAAWFSRNMR